MSKHVDLQKIILNLISMAIYSHYNFHMKTQNLSRVSIPYKLISFAFYTCIPYFKDQNDIRYTINDIYQFLLKCTFVSESVWICHIRSKCILSAWIVTHQYLQIGQQELKFIAPKMCVFFEISVMRMCSF